jgi:hypothetical protein
MEQGRMGKHAPIQISRGTGGPLKPGFGLSGAGLQLDNVFLPLFRVFVPLILTDLHSSDANIKHKVPPLRRPSLSR